MQTNAETTIELTIELGEGFAIDPDVIPIDLFQGISLLGFGRTLQLRHVLERADVGDTMILSTFSKLA